MLTGVYAARNIVGEKLDVWSVNTEMEYHEEVRAGDASTKVRAASNGDRLVPARVQPVVAPAQISADDLIEAAFAKLDAVALGTALSLVCGLSVLLATVALLLKGGETVGPRLALLGNYFIGFSVTLEGAFVGMLWAGVLGFGLGYVWAMCRNWGVDAFAYMVRRRAEVEARRHLLDKV